MTEAFDYLQQQAQAFSNTTFYDRLEQCRVEFSYMKKFMLQGFKDAQREKLFRDMQQRLKDLWYDICVQRDIIESPYIKGLQKTLKNKDLSIEALQAQLLSANDIKQHNEVLSLAFLVLYSSGHWRMTQVEEWLMFITSSHVNHVDAATLTGAITLSCMEHFSYHKALCLARIYVESSDDDVKQRAFVGCLLSLCRADETDKDLVAKVLDVIFSSDQAASDLLEMQMQMYSCSNVDKDSTEIRSKIMPNIIRNQPFRITKDGIFEKDDDDDAIDTDASDKRMEEMEDSIRKMLKMQKDGADIFFEGFSQMKRYPFFYKMANWFMPFYLEHPDISTYMKSLNNNEFLDKVMKRGPFCNSDKYSFVIAFSSVVGHLPDNVREMMNNGEVGPIGMHKSEEELQTPSFYRLQYLQDLYRFYRLNPIANNLYNPFKETEKFSVWSVAVGKIDRKDLASMCRYLVKRVGGKAANEALHSLLNLFTDKDCMEYTYYSAELSLQEKRYNDAIEAYKKVLLQNHSHKPSMRGMARAYYATGNYTKAAFYFDALHTLFPEKLSYHLNYIMSRVKEGNVSDVINELYQLEYENPEDATIRNTLGWALLYSGKAEQALAIYDKTDNSVPETDFSFVLNHAYALMATGKMNDAASLLTANAACHTADDNSSFRQLLRNSMSEDSDLLEMYGIGAVEQMIFLDAVFAKQ